MNDFVTWSGWVVGIIGFPLGIYGAWATARARRERYSVVDFEVNCQRISLPVVAGVALTLNGQKVADPHLTTLSWELLRGPDVTYETGMSLARLEGEGKVLTVMWGDTPLLYGEGMVEFRGSAIARPGQALVVQVVSDGPIQGESLLVRENLRLETAPDRDGRARRVDLWGSVVAIFLMAIMALSLGGTAVEGAIRGDWFVAGVWFIGSAAYLFVVVLTWRSHKKASRK